MTTHLSEPISSGLIFLTCIMHNAILSRYILYFTQRYDEYVEYLSIMHAVQAFYLPIRQIDQFRAVCSLGRLVVTVFLSLFCYQMLFFNFVYKLFFSSSGLLIYSLSNVELGIYQLPVSEFCMMKLI